ncbi:competence type IV pilus ATPase ComGA [Streptococcus didelphis]|uniref:competence type IV pilus ATPase ComGA n=1 Tax=Streptococcus didelphis TaxID=102886 RepID=UPI00037494DF|nr:competence type IV pilus ATPase ComGA [Streptococcus didelphis]WMB29440.1 competence type IV pilus ATPase ComGA [Streptococcus didelphis]
MIPELGKYIISKANSLQVQDIYILPHGLEYHVILRSGDQSQTSDIFDKEKAANLISHFKFVAGMNVGEKRRSQLGACDYPLDDKQKISLRLSSVGDYRGLESLVIRLLYSSQKDLNYWFKDDEKLAQQLGGRGLYLFSGPVGSGKTSLMHQLIAQQTREKQVITIEDPVEIKNDQLLQLQVNESIGMTYDQLIKLSLRHRPDLLIIGEIRDSKTAKAVIRASLTGAMVFSTIHAKSIPGVYARLLELGIQKEEIKNTLTLVTYQRLIAQGGLIDFASKDFQNHTHQEWNQKIDSLLKEGHLTETQAEFEKITL